MEQKLGCLVLENGMVFHGTRIGSLKNVVAEIVFATGMNGYLETLTDPSYFGQAVVQTFPLIGNYGVIPQDFESRKPFLSAYIMADCCDKPSNFRNQGELEAYLTENDIPALCGADTRTLTRVLRENGTMNGMICDTPEQADMELIRSYRVQEAVRNTTCDSPYTLGSPDAKRHVVLMDFGAKENIARCLVNRDCRVTVVPAYTTAEQISAMQPDGIMLSNGAGNPQENVEIIQELKKITALKIPMMAICLGHQLMALANNISTSKLKFGHRGANQPVLNLETNRMAVSTQNHGYQVLYDPQDAHCREVADLLFININDQTCEGLRYKHFPALSVQFHPEACAGPQDTEYLFDEFIEMMGGSSNAAES
ncbi:MAG: carbamoyl phosphate synthase small subunit [Oscillospiraceae bacterium]|nr:carbamoyl phosphate synthase small subunit [Oscillospiraceae bacterium]